MYFAIYPAKFGLNTLWNHLLRKLDIEDSLNPKEDREIKEDPLGGGGGWFLYRISKTTLMWLMWL